MVNFIFLVFVVSKMLGFRFFNIRFQFTDNVVYFSVPLLSPLIEDNIKFSMFLFKSALWTGKDDAISWYLGYMTFLSSSKCACKVWFFLSKNFKMCTTSWVSCFFEEKHCTQTETSHCLQWSSTSFAVWFWHSGQLILRLDYLSLIGTTIWNWDPSNRCSPAQVLHRLIRQILQYRGGHVLHTDYIEWHPEGCN